MAKKKNTRVVLPGGIQGLVHDLQNGTSQFKPKPIELDTKDEDEREEELEEENVELVVVEQPVPSAETKPSGTEEISVESGVGESTVEKAKTTEREVVQTEVTPVDQPAPKSVAKPAPQPTPVEQEPVVSNDKKIAPAQETVSVISDDNEAEDLSHQRGRRPKENTMKEYRIVKDDSRESWDLFIDMAQQYKTGGGKLATIYIDESLKNVLDRLKYAGTERLPTSAILSSVVARFIYDHEDDIKRELYSGTLI